MDHQAIQEQVFAFYDGELTGESRRAVEGHLAGCAECRALLTRWKRAAGVFFDAPDVSSSEAFVEGVMRRIAAPRPARSLLPQRLLEIHWGLPAFGLAAVLMLMVLGSGQSAVSVDALLLSEGRDSAGLQQVFSTERPSADDVLGLLVEGAS